VSILARLETSVNATEATLAQVDRNLARLSARGMPVTAAADLVARLTNNQPVQWAIGQRAYRPNPACAYAAIVTERGAVSVWQCDRRGWLDRFLGTITENTTRADVWRMRQRAGMRRAFELGLLHGQGGAQ
jgi:hypothetical protein